MIRKNRKLFPMYIDISDKKVVVIGGGNAALQRVQTMLEYECKIVVIDSNLHETLCKYADEEKITVKRRNYERDDIYDADMVLVTTSDKKMNDEIYSVCKCMGIVVNVTTNVLKCDFHFPTDVVQ